jgi:hypothetical protein
MPKISNRENWDELEEHYAEEDVRDKFSHKPKKHDAGEWVKIDKKLQKENKDKHVKNKHREAHKNSHNVS